MSDYEERLAQEITKIQEYRKSLEEEFSGDSEAGSPEWIKAELKKLLPSAVSTLAFLSDHAEKETTRAAVAKFIVEKNLEELKRGDVDELTKLLDSMRSS